MPIIWNKLFLILRSVSNRALVVWPCLFLIVLNTQDAPTKDLDRKIDTGKIKIHEKRMGPFKINEREFTVILKLINYGSSPTKLEKNHIFKGGGWQVSRVEQIRCQ